MTDPAELKVKAAQSLAADYELTETEAEQRVDAAVAAMQAETPFLYYGVVALENGQERQAGRSGDSLARA